MNDLWKLETSIRRLKYFLAADAVERSLRNLALAVKFDPNQPRIPAGQEGGGQWTSDEAGETVGGVSTIEVESAASADASGAEGIFEEILAKARKLNLLASPNSYRECADLCHPLLERYKKGGTDYNYWNFQRCLNACLGKNISEEKWIPI